MVPATRAGAGGAADHDDYGGIAAPVTTASDTPETPDTMEKPLPVENGAPRVAPHPAEHLQIVVAEDDPDMREMIASVLTAEGYAVITARDGSELIARLHDLAKEPHGRRTLATIIADVRMPGLGGLDVLAALRCAGWQTPVILITAFGDEATHREARDLGAVRVLDKPFALDSLVALVRRIAPAGKCHQPDS
jgi:CheY-like chemotaxis protein